LSHARRALETEPDNPLLLDNLGLSYIGMSNPWEALCLFELSLSLATGMILGIVVDDTVHLLSK
jgi:hypothetical protein